MRRLIYSMGVSLDGYVAGPSGQIDWAAPDEELHGFHNRQMREVEVHLCGRRLYETMVYWESAGVDPSLSGVGREFAGIWQGIEKIVFAGASVPIVGRSRLAREGLVDELATLKRQPGGDIAVGGAGLAASLAERDLIDEYRLFLSPVVLGGGTPYFPRISKRLELSLLETKTFGSRVLYMRYGRP